MSDDRMPSDPAEPEPAEPARKERSPEERAARAAYNREYNARKRREAYERDLAEREQRWAKPAQQEEGVTAEAGIPPPFGRPSSLSAAGPDYSIGHDSMSEKPEVEEAVEELALTQDQGLAPEPEPVAEPGPQTPFDVYLSMLPPETIELLDMDDLRKAFDDAAHDAREERRKQLRQQARDRAKETARAAAGLLTPEEVERRQVRERLSRRVKVTPTLPFVSDTGGVAAPSISIDGVEYQHGQQATMPLSRALDIRHILYCLQQNELDFEGKGRLHGLRRQQHEATNMVRI
jgi:hypothetical protein